MWGADCFPTFSPQGREGLVSMPSRRSHCAGLCGERASGEMSADRGATVPGAHPSSPRSRKTFHRPRPALVRVVVVRAVRGICFPWNREMPNLEMQDDPVCPRDELALVDAHESSTSCWGPFEDACAEADEIIARNAAPLPPWGPEDGFDLVRGVNHRLEELDHQIERARGVVRDILLLRRKQLIRKSGEMLPDGISTGDLAEIDMAGAPAQALVRVLSPAGSRRVSRILYSQPRVRLGIRRRTCGGRRRPGPRRARTASRAGPSDPDEPAPARGGHHRHVVVPGGRP